VLRAVATYTSLVPASAWFELIAFGLGLLFGSFLNVCISRLPWHQSIAERRSRCARCHHTIHWYDNIPLLSFALLRGRCRHCQVHISWRYPAVELAVGAWFALVAGWAAATPGWTGSIWALMLNPETGLPVIANAVLGFLLIGLMVMDWQTQHLPDAFTLTGAGIGFFVLCVQAMFLPSGVGDVVLNTTHQLRLSSPGSFTSQGNVFLTGTEALVFGRLGSMALMALLLYAIGQLYTRLRGREALGLGDVKLIAMITAFLGLWGSVLALLAGVLAGAVFGVAQMARRRAGLATAIPFGSFLCAGGLFAALLGQRVIEWYAGLLR
jgi:leader peptidase (prepilin peptidase)/N-methyltransferase